MRLFTFIVLALPLAAFGAPAGAVYTATNSATNNHILIFDRNADGSLTASGSVSTGGLGTGSGLGNQSGIALTQNQRYLLVVNAGSNEISSLAIGPQGLSFTDKIWSGGTRPISVTVIRDLVYVLNAGSDNISGFSIASNGQLTPIAGSTLPLSAPNSNAAQIGFNADGNLLAVTEKGTSRISIYTVDHFGVAHGPSSYPSAGATPFGFNFGKRDQLFVSEAPGSAVSSYSVSDSGELQLISASVADHQTAACWLVVSHDGRFAYAANAATANVSAYSIDESGAIALNGAGIAGTTAPGPVDEAFTPNGRYLFTLNARSGSISIFSVGEDGSLTKLPDAVVPVNTNGLAAR